jgi:hypothetical protein
MNRPGARVLLVIVNGASGSSSVVFIDWRGELGAVLKLAPVDTIVSFSRVRGLWKGWSKLPTDGWRASRRDNDECAPR